jgi:hypothetical protein
VGERLARGSGSIRRLSGGGEVGELVGRLRMLVLHVLENWALRDSLSSAKCVCHGIMDVKCLPFARLLYAAAASIESIVSISSCFAASSSHDKA